MIKGLGFRRFRRVSIPLLAVGALAACSQLTSSPQPVQSTTPTVTYNYRSDQELIQANQNASTYCAQYQASPRSSSVTNNADGSKTVVFQCVAAGLPAPAPISPNLRHTYRTDQELVQASQTASAYCQRTGTLPMTSSIVTNADGSRTVTFQCGPR
jgi:hypothetical protein